MELATQPVSSIPRRRFDIPEIAEAFVAAHADLFVGWPSRSLYMHDIHCDVLARLRPLLPDRLARERRHKLWLYLTEAVNARRTQRAATYRSQVNVWDWDEWGES